MSTKELRERCEKFAAELKGDDWGYSETVACIREAPGCHDAKAVILAQAQTLEQEAARLYQFATSLPDDLVERWEKQT